MQTEIKICGVNSVPAIDAAIECGADYVGLVFFPPSPRNVSMADAAELAGRSGDRIRRVGLFVEPDDSLVERAIEAGKLDALQLHGEETPQRVAEIRSRFALPVWKALPVASAADVSGAEKYRDAADLILFDARTPKGSNLPGGMGLSFDWSLLDNYKGPLKWGLAGGLTPNNVAAAIARTGAPLVDTSSGVESAPGIKDVDRIAAFCKAARTS